MDERQWQEQHQPHQSEYEAERIPPELDPAFSDLDEGPAGTLFNRAKPLIWIVATVTLVGLIIYLWPK